METLWSSFWNASWAGSAGLMLVIGTTGFTTPSSCTAAPSSNPPTALHLEVGDVKVLDTPAVTRVAVGAGHVLTALPQSGAQVLVFARESGQVDLQVWARGGQRWQYRVDIAPAGTRQARQEIRALLAHLPGVHSTQVGGHFLIEGQGLSDAQRQRLNQVSQRYPQLLSFVSDVGWDRMVLFDVQVIEMPSTTLKQWGVHWDGTSVGGLSAGLAWNALRSAQWSQPPEGTPGPWPSAGPVGQFGINATLAAQIEALANQGQAVVLARPQLVARSGATAQFQAGGEIPYRVTDRNGGSNTQFKPYGVSLKITPQIGDDDSVRSRIDIEASSVDSSFSTDAGPALRVSRAATEFNLRSGQTLALAGFLSRSRAQGMDAVPGVGDIPVLGGLFRHRKVTRQETELVVFVTPHLVSANQGELATRVVRAKQAVDTAFPTPPRLLTPLHDGKPTWDPYRSAGSQWQAAP